MSQAGVPGAGQNAARIVQIRTLLEQSLAPRVLDVFDESYLHAGHVGARDGRGHFRVRLDCAAFAGKPLLARHRLVYAALGTLMQSDIHALAIEAGPFDKED